jgi:hypothetical protein
MINRRRRTRTSALLLAVTAVAVLAAGGTTAALASAAHPAGTAGRASAGHAAASPVVVSCAGKNQTRPSQFVLACGDGNAGLTHLSWAAWGTSAAFGHGTYEFNDCVPYCAAGHGHHFAVLTALWRPEALPGHAGTRYFTRLTIIYTGRHRYTAGGKTYRLPGTQTFTLYSAGG